MKKTLKHSKEIPLGIKDYLGTLLLLLIYPIYFIVGNILITYWTLTGRIKRR